MTLLNLSVVAVQRTITLSVIDVESRVSGGKAHRDSLSDTSLQS